MLADPMAVYRYRTSGSWSSRAQDPAYRIAARQSIIDGLTAFNIATDYQYDEIVASRIKVQKYNIARLSRDWKMLRSAELREVWNSRAWHTKLSDFLACKAPGLQRILLQKLKQK